MLRVSSGKPVLTYQDVVGVKEGSLLRPWIFKRGLKPLQGPSPSAMVLRGKGAGSQTEGPKGSLAPGLLFCLATGQLASKGLGHGKSKYPPSSQTRDLCGPAPVLGGIEIIGNPNSSQPCTCHLWPSSFFSCVAPQAVHPNPAQNSSLLPHPFARSLPHY